VNQKNTRSSAVGKVVERHSSCAQSIERYSHSKQKRFSGEREREREVPIKRSPSAFWKALFSMDLLHA
jgi:hypothetical protein